MAEPQKVATRRIPDIKEQLIALRQKGQPRPYNRQVGAWQSTAVSPYTKLEDLQMVASARTVVPSAQEWQRLEEAKALLTAFENMVQDFQQNQWNPFVDEFKKIYPVVFGEKEEGKTKKK